MFRRTVMMVYCCSMLSTDLGVIAFFLPTCPVFLLAFLCPIPSSWFSLSRRPFLPLCLLFFLVA